MKQVYRHARWLAALAALMAPAAGGGGARGDEGSSPQISKAPFAEAVVQADADLKAGKATAWSDQSAQFLLLERDVTVEVGSYGFRARRAMVRIDTERHPGRVIRHLSMYLENAQPVRGKGQVTAQARRLLVTVSTTGVVNLSADLLEQAQDPPGDELVAAAADRVRRYRTAQLRPVMAVPAGPPIFDPSTESVRSVRRAAVHEELVNRRTVPMAESVTGDRPPPPTPPPPPRRTKGVFIPDWEKFQYRPTDEGGMLLLYGGVSVTYANYDDNEAISLSCQNAVIFFAPQSDYTAGAPQIKEGDVRGIYLEDNVIVTNGPYTVRAPRAYYDAQTQKAIVLEAVFFAWDPKRKVPLYVRAEKLRQHSLESWTAKNGLFTTSEFAEPHFAIAADDLTLRLLDKPDGTTVPHVTAEKISPQFGARKVGSLGRYEGDLTDIPLRRVEGRFDNRRGPIIKTRWDAYGLVGKEAPPGVDLMADIDLVGEHGPAVGLELDYEKPDLYGSMKSYLVALDNGTDRIGGRDIDQHDETRGFLRWQHRKDLGDNLDLSLELGYVSDNTFLEEFERSEAEESKPYEASIYLKHQKEDESLSLLGSYDLLNFTAQTTTLQAPGYTVEKMPELTYHRVGTSLLGNRLTYYTENRVSRMRINVGNDTPKDRGFNMVDSMATFGIPNTVKFDDAATAAGIPQNFVNRLDTRHELQAPMNFGAVDVVPYAAGRATFYDQDFDDFAGETDDSRLWGMVGARLHTSVTRTYDNVENQVLNLHRLRHIVEPAVDMFFAHSTIDSEDLPVFDSGVEDISEGTGLRFALRNTFQTQRGGPGRWRNVDYLVVNTNLILRSSDADGDPVSELPRNFSYRPEFSRGRDHVYADMAWILSDTFAFTADLTQDLEETDLAQLHAGVVMTHTPLLQSYIEYESVNALGSRLLSLGLSYQMTRKYKLGLVQKLDLDREETRRFDVILERKLPRWTLLIRAAVDNIDDDVGVGFVLIPDGVKSSNRLGRLWQ